MMLEASVLTERSEGHERGLNSVQTEVLPTLAFAGDALNFQKRIFGTF